MTLFAKLFLSLAAFSLAACAAYPERTTMQGAAAGGIAIVGDFDAASVYVDGQLVGPASRFSGDQSILQLPRGTHRIEVLQSDGSILYNEDVYVGSGIVRIEI